MCKVHIFLLTIQKKLSKFCWRTVVFKSTTYWNECLSTWLLSLSVGNRTKLLQHLSVCVCVCFSSFAFETALFHCLICFPLLAVHSHPPPAGQQMCVLSWPSLLGAAQQPAAPWAHGAAPSPAAALKHGVRPLYRVHISVALAPPHTHLHPPA